MHGFHPHPFLARPARQMYLLQGHIHYLCTLRAVHVLYLAWVSCTTLLRVGDRPRRRRVVPRRAHHVKQRALGRRAALHCSTTMGSNAPGGNGGMPPNAPHVNLQGRPQQGNVGVQMNSLQGLQPALANNPEFMAIVNAARQGRVSEEQLQQVRMIILTF